MPVGEFYFIFYMKNQHFDAPGLVPDFFVSTDYSMVVTWCSGKFSFAGTPLLSSPSPSLAALDAPPPPLCGVRGFSPEKILNFSIAIDAF
jgi:hypothetical protein